MDNEMAKAMGFSGFGTQKKARDFDFMKMLEESKKIAQERNKKGNENLDEAGTSSISTSQEGNNKESKKTVQKEKRDNDDDDDDEDDEEEVGGSSQLSNFIPASHEVVLGHGVKPITAVAIDPSGSRLITGGYDFEMKFWDFAGMDSSCRSFKTLRPCESHQMKHIEFSPSGDNLLLISGNSQAKVMSRDGVPDAECTRGYPYISHPANATGHTHTLNWGCWHPRNGTDFLTCANDCCVRMWDSSQVEVFLTDRQMGKKAQKAVIIPRNSQGRKIIPTTCAYSRDAGLVAAGCVDGSIQMWDTRKMFVNVALMCRTAHAPNSHICSLDFAYDNRMFASRGMDDTMKLWDVRNLSRSVHAFTGLETMFEQTNCTFSPNDRIVMTGVAAPRGSSAGGVRFFNRDTGELVNKLTLDHGSVVRTLWHPRLNQMVMTNSDGKVIVYYDIERSHNGAKLCAFKAKRKAAFSETFTRPLLLTYDEESEKAARKGKRRTKYLEDGEAGAPKERGEARRKMAPPSHGNNLGMKGASLHQFMVQQLVLPKTEDPGEKDIRGTILRHEKDAQANPIWTKGYSKTQPIPVFRKPEEDTVEDTDLPAWKKQKLA